MQKRIIAGIAGAAIIVLCSCQRASTGARITAGPNSFTILAGSELKDIETGLKDDIRRATGLDLAFTYSGTLEAVDRLAAGDQFDALWVSHGKYLAMNDGMRGRILAQEKTMLSPVLLGLKASKARALGWDRQEPTWKEIADAAKAGKFTFGMTNPTSSNTGLTATIGLAAALAKNPDALTDDDLKNPRLSDFFKGQTAHLRIVGMAGGNLRARSIEGGRHYQLRVGPAFSECRRQTLRTSYAGLSQRRHNYGRLSFNAFERGQASRL